MKLFYTKRSPYASKVRAVAAFHNINLELIEIADLTKKPVELVSANPLGKIPALLLNNGISIFDSPVICQYLDSLGNGKKLLPQEGFKRYHVLTIEAAADGIMDSCVALFMENLRPEDKRLDAFLQKNIDTISRTLQYFNDNVDSLENDLNLGTIALASAISYINFRFSDKINLEKSYPNLHKWYNLISKHEPLLLTKPQA